jgi:hypothetical protein
VVCPKLWFYVEHKPKFANCTRAYVFRCNQSELIFTVEETLEINLARKGPIEAWSPEVLKERLPEVFVL